MAYYLLQMVLPGPRSYRAAASEKHQIEARSLDEAKWYADEIIVNNYDKIDKAVMRLFDETGLVATRNGEGPWGD